MAITTTEQTSILNLVVSMFNAAPGAANLTSIVAYYEANGRSLTNVANALASSTAFTDQFAGLVTNEGVANKMAANFGLTSGTAYTNAYNYFVNELAAGHSKASIMKAANDYLIGTHDAMFNDAASTLTNKTTVALDYSVTKQLSGATIADLRAAVSGVDATAASVTTKIAAAASSTFALTTGVDTIVGTTGTDIINATATATFNGLDSIDGGAGTDTLNVSDNTAAIATTGRTVTNVETANLTSASTVTADTTAWTGLTTLKAIGAGGVNVTAAATTTSITATNTGANAMAIIGGGGVATLTTGAAAVTVGQTAVANAYTSVAVTGGSTVAITDKSGAALATGTTLKTVSVTSATDDTTITADGLTTLNVTTLTGASGVGDVTVTAAAGTRALALNLNGVDVAGDAAVTGGAIVITDATATSLAITNATAASYDVTTVAGAATAATINATAALQMTALTLNTAATIAVAGTAAVTVAAHTIAATTAITSTNTAGVTFTGALAVGVDFDGGDGADAVTLGATTKGITMGAGNDTVTLSTGVTALGTNGSIDAGAGTADVLSFTTHANAVTASAATTFAGTISNFEKLTLGAIAASTGTAGADNTTVALANLDSINYVTLAGAGASAAAQTHTISGFTTGGTFAETAILADADTTVALTGAFTGASDAFNLVATHSGTTALVNVGVLTLASVETLAISLDNTHATTVATTVYDLNLDATSATSVTVTGDTGITFANSSLTAVRTMNASGVTGTAAAGAVTFTANAGMDTTITGGAGNDGLNGNTGNDTIVGGAGVDTITGAAGADAITGGEGADTITGGTGLDTITLTETTSAVDNVILVAVATATAADADTITGFTTAKDTITTDDTAGAGALAIGTQIAAGANQTATIANITLAGNTDADVYYINNTMALSLTQIETAITAGSAATGETYFLVDNGTSTLLYFDAASQTDAGSGAGMILMATLVGITGSAALATGDLLSV